MFVSLQKLFFHLYKKKVQLIHRFTGRDNTPVTICLPVGPHVMSPECWTKALTDPSRDSDLLNYLLAPSLAPRPDNFLKLLCLEVTACCINKGKKRGMWVVVGARWTVIIEIHSLNCASPPRRNNQGILFLTFNQGFTDSNSGFPQV